MKYLLLLFLSVFLCCSNAINLTDNYWLYPEDEFGNGYYLICKLSSENDPKIENIKAILWNDKYIIIEEDIESEERWRIIEAKNENLKCGCGDKLSGYVSEIYILDFIHSKALDLNKKILVK